MRGFDGNDYIIAEHVDGNVLIEGGAGGDLVAGTHSDDRLFGGTQADLEPLVKGMLSENNEPDAVHGRGGDDLVVGGNSNDWLAGGRGADEIYGGAGDDLIAGGGDMYGNGWYTPGTPTPFRRDTLIFNVDVGGPGFTFRRHLGVLRTERPCHSRRDLGAS